MPEALFLVLRLDSKDAKVCKSCRSRKELSNEYLLATFGVDTAENGPLKVCQKLEEQIIKNIEPCLPLQLRRLRPLPAGDVQNLLHEARRVRVDRARVSTH